MLGFTVRGRADLIAGGQAEGFDDGGPVRLRGDALVLVIVQPDLPGRSSHLQQIYYN